MYPSSATREHASHSQPENGDPHLRAFLESIPKSLLRELTKRQQQGWCLSAGWPRPWGLRDLRGRYRLFFFRPNLCSTSLRSVISSSLPKGAADLADWRAFFECALRDIQRERATLLYSRDVAIGDRVEHAARCFDLNRLRIEPNDRKWSPSEWLLESTLRAEDRSFAHSLFISPPIDDTVPMEERENQDTTIRVPEADEWLVSLPDRIYALSIREKGRIWHRLRHRLQHSDYPVGQVWIARSSGSQKPPKGELPATVGWWIPFETRNESLANTPDPAFSPTLGILSPKIQSLAAWEAHCGDDWLTHCTRALPNAWPDESFEKHEDLLWLKGGHTETRTPYDSLARILQMMRLIATDRLKRTGVATVCFSSVKLSQLLGRRTFRKHLHRWDYEPYGICIRKESAQKLGARPCLYGNDEDFEQLPTTLRPFFQWQGNKELREGGEDPNWTEWKSEEEWRIIGDVRLSQLGPNDCIVFVPTLTIADKIARLSPFPIVVTSKERFPSDG